MAQTIIGLFPDEVTAQRALTELGAAGLTRTHMEGAADGDRQGRYRISVETDADPTSVREILLRAGAQDLEQREVGAGVAYAQIRREEPPPARARPHEALDAHEERHPHGGDWLREIVFGLNDGLVTTLVFIMAASEVAQTHAALLLVALSEIAAGGVSMSLGGFLSARTERDILDYRIATERHEIATEPEEERAELRDIYRRKGMTGRLLDSVIAHQTADHERWLRALVHDELGVVGEDAAIVPWVQGLQIGASFVLGGIIPAIPVFLSLAAPWLQVVAYLLTALTALALGAVKARYSLKGPLRNGLEFLGIVTGGTLAGVAIGLALHAV